MADKANFIGCLDLNCYSTVGLHRRPADTGAITNSSSRGYHRSRAIADTDSLVDTTSVSNDSSTDAGTFVHSDTVTNNQPYGYPTPDACSHRRATSENHSHRYATPNTHSHRYATPNTHFHGCANPDAGFHF